MSDAYYSFKRHVREYDIGVEFDMGKQYVDDELDSIYKKAAAESNSNLRQAFSRGVFVGQRDGEVSLFEAIRRIVELGEKGKTDNETLKTLLDIEDISEIFKVDIKYEMAGQVTHKIIAYSYWLAEEYGKPEADAELYFASWNIELGLATR